MPRYMILNSGKVTWFWDALDEQMFKEEDELVEKVKGDLHMLEKMEPYLSIKEQTDIRPEIITFDEAENRKRAFGK